MIGEESQLHDTQGSGNSQSVNTSEGMEEMDNKTMTSEPDLQSDADVNQDSRSGDANVSPAGAAPESGSDADDFYAQSIDQLEIEDAEEQPGYIPADGGQPNASNAAEVAELRQQRDALKSQVAELTRQLDDRVAQQKRISADFENFRRRTQREKEELEDKVKCSTVVELLPVVDNFERARSQIKPQTDPEMEIHKSYQTVYRQLVECLKRIGVSPMRAEGKEFDPNLHDAVMREATAEHSEGTVMEELMRGYLLGDRVLRHAMVKVAAAPDPVIPSDEQNDEEPGE